jgi:hypothetical protein
MSEDGGMTELVEWLRACLDEDERVARAAMPGPWTTPGDDTVGEWMIYGAEWAVASAHVSEYHGDFPKLRGGPTGDDANRNAEHIARHNPARVLAEVDAKRRLLDLFTPAPREPETDRQLHERSAHPAYEYATTEGQRKAWDFSNVPPEGEGWERNVDAGRDGWDRFDYTEESYWRRLLPDGPRPEWIPIGLRLLALPYADREGFRREWRPADPDAA